MNIQPYFVQSRYYTDFMGCHFFRDYNDYPVWLDIYTRKEYYKKNRENFLQLYLQCKYKKNTEPPKRHIMLETNEEKFNQYLLNKNFERPMRNLLKDIGLKLIRKSRK